jgi:hypothetical protein
MDGLMDTYAGDVTKDTKPKKKKDGRLVDTLPIEGKVDKDYVPEGFDDVEDFLCDMRKQYEADVEYDRINRDEALSDKKFAAGEQWDPVVLEQRKGLPCLVINNIPQFTAQLVGDWRQDRKAVKVVPSNDEDVDIASVRGDLIRSIEMQSRADRVYDSSFESLVQCGDGAFRVSVEYARDSVFDQDIFIRPIEDALAVVWDRFSVDPTGRDAKRVFVDDRMPKDEFHAKWPGIEVDSVFADRRGERVAIAGWVDDDSYRITEYWRLVEREKLYALFENGRIYEVSEDNIEELTQQNGQPTKMRSSWATYAQMHLVTGFAILSGPYEYKLNRLPIIRMSGRVVNVGGRRVRYGIVRFMKDPVRLKNFWRSVAAEQLGYAPKAQWIAPESAVEGREETFRKAHLSRDPLIVYNDGAETPPQRLEPPTPQAALDGAAQVNAQDMKDVTGIQDASLGIQSNEVSGRAITARQREGDIASLTFYDNADAAVLEGGDVINQLIPQIYDGTRVIRTIGEDETLKFMKINDPMDPKSVDLAVGMFDVALSTGTSYTTRRVEAAQAMMDAIQVWPQLMTVAGDLVAKAQDWPGADKLAERLHRTIPPQYLGPDDQQDGPGIDPGQFQQMQQTLQKLQIENTVLKMQAKDKSDSIQIDEYKAETDRIRALSDNQVDANQMEMSAIKMILDGSMKLDEHDIQRAQSLVGQQQHHDKMDQADQQFSQQQDSQAQALDKTLAVKSKPAGQSATAGGTSSQSGGANG